MARRPVGGTEPVFDPSAFDPAVREGGTAGPVRERTGVTVLRPADLLFFRADWTDLSLEKDGAGGRGGGFGGSDLARPGELVAGPKGGTLAVSFPFQHATEAAREEDKDPAAPAPVPARAAGPSRLVFAVPPGGRVPYSVAGLLDAMGRLEMAVAPAAAGPAGAGPRPGWGSVPGPVRSPLIGYLAEREGTTLRTGRAKDTPASSPLGRAQVALVAGRLAAAGALSAVDLDDLVVPAPKPPKLPPVRKPKAGETAIEAPFRLLLSPAATSGWVHAATPAAPEGDPGRVELWQTRLATRRRRRDGTLWLDEAPDRARTVRAIWTRDRDRTAPGPREDVDLASLKVDWRQRIVAQTAGDPSAPTVAPTPIQVRHLALSSLGAFLDVHVQWPWASYPENSGAIASWDHVAAMGRDQFVRVVEPGFLYPLGHSAYLVTITYRRVSGDAKPVAGLFRRQFLVLGDPDRSYTSFDLPFVSANLGPLRTPDLAPVKDAPADKDPPEPPPPTSPEDTNCFVPRLEKDGPPLLWKVDARDQDGRPVSLRMPLVWVRALKPGLGPKAAELYKDLATVSADGQSIAFAPAQASGDGGAGGQAAAEAQTLTFEAASVTQRGAVPRMTTAKLVVPAMKRLTPGAPAVDMSYAEAYRAGGFGPGNPGQVYLGMTSPDSAVALSFGSSERSGGFVQPDVAVRALARGAGLVSDIGQAVQGKFSAESLFAGNLPKLFGLIPLSDIVDDVLLDLAPKFLTDELDKVTALLRDLEQLHALVRQGSELADKAAGTDVQAVVDKVRDSVGPVVDRFKELLDPDQDLGEKRTALETALTDLHGALRALRDRVPDVPLGPAARSALDRLVAALGTALEIEKQAGAVLDKVLDAIEQLRNAVDPGGKELRARLEWKPQLKDWNGPFSEPVFLASKDGKAAKLVVSVETRAAAGKPPAADTAAELTDFALDLVPGAKLMRVKFERLAFRASLGRKPEIDVVFGGIEFLGVLGFVNVLSEIIPLDGFSDPPFVDVSTEGVTAGFTLALPNLAIGVFSLSNLAIAADARIPFLGDDVLSVGFAFCTRERPFTLAVAILGGGGFVGIRLSPQGLMLLEAAFEFGAVVALDFGVASGSVSAMAGIYFRLEGDAASLTGYFRVRGEVDVLGLISASIELYLALSYESATGKMVGEASLTVSVEVLFFSTSVTIHTRRTFAGSNGDPTAAQMLLPNAGEPVTKDGQTVPWNGRSTIWEDYCEAFRPAKQEG